MAGKIKVPPAVGVELWVTVLDRVRGGSAVGKATGTGTGAGIGDSTTTGGRGSSTAMYLMSLFGLFVCFGFYVDRNVEEILTDSQCIENVADVRVGYRSEEFCDLGLCGSIMSSM